MAAYKINRTLQPADFEPISFGVEEDTYEKALEAFNTMQDDILRAFDTVKATTPLKRGGEPPHIEPISTLKMPPKGKK